MGLSILRIAYCVFRFIFVASLIVSCATPQPPTSNFQLPAANPRPPTLRPTEDTPQPPTAILAPTTIPKEANGKIVAAMWDAGDEMLKEFKANGGAVSSAVAESEIKFVPRWSTSITLDGKTHKRSFSSIDTPAQFIGAREFNIGGYRAPYVGEVAPETYAAVLYFVDLTTLAVIPITFAPTYEGRFNWGGYGWLALNSDFFDGISKFAPITARELPGILRDHVGKQLIVSPALWFDPQTIDALNNKYALHSALYKVDGFRSAVCSSPTMQSLSEEEVTKRKLTRAQVWETFKADGALPPCMSLIQKR